MKSIPSQLLPMIQSQQGLNVSFVFAIKWSEQYTGYYSDHEFTILNNQDEPVIPQALVKSVSGPDFISNYDGFAEVSSVQVTFKDAFGQLRIWLDSGDVYLKSINASVYLAFNSNEKVFWLFDGHVKYDIEWKEAGNEITLEIEAFRPEGEVGYTPIKDDFIDDPFLFDGERLIQEEAWPTVFGANVPVKLPQPYKRSSLEVVSDVVIDPNTSLPVSGLLVFGNAAGLLDSINGRYLLTGGGNGIWGLDCICTVTNNLVTVHSINPHLYEYDPNNSSSQVLFAPIEADFTIPQYKMEMDNFTEQLAKSSSFPVAATQNPPEPQTDIIEVASPFLLTGDWLNTSIQLYYNLGQKKYKRGTRTIVELINKYNLVGNVKPYRYVFRLNASIPLIPYYNAVIIKMWKSPSRIDRISKGTMIHNYFEPDVFILDAKEGASTTALFVDAEQEQVKHIEQGFNIKNTDGTDSDKLWIGQPKACTYIEVPAINLLWHQTINKGGEGVYAFVDGTGGTVVGACEEILKDTFVTNVVGPHIPLSAALREVEDIETIIPELCWQFNLATRFHYYELQLIDLRNPSPSVMTITDEHVLLNSVSYTYSPYDNIKTIFRFSYLLDILSPVKTDVFKRNVDKYGKHTLEADMWAHLRGVTPNVYRNFWMQKLSRPHRQVKFTGFLEMLKLEIWDVVTLNINDPFLQHDKAFLTQVPTGSLSTWNGNYFVKELATNIDNGTVDVTLEKVFQME